MNTPQQIYATIKRSSKYYGQAAPGAPFPVCISEAYDNYVVRGNNNRYRLADVWLQIRNDDGSYMRISK